MLYRVTAERRGEWWALQAADAPGALSQVAHLSDADQIREAIAFVTGEPEDAITIEVQIVMAEPDDRRFGARHVADFAGAGMPSLPTRDEYPLS